MATIARRLGISTIAGTTDANRTANTNSVSGSVRSTLTNFGVPTGNTGTNARDRGGILMPKLKYRFRVLVFGFGTQAANGVSGIDFTQQVISCGRPSPKHQETPIHSYNSITYVAGKAEWDTIQIKLRDDLSNTMSRLVGAQMQRQMNHFEQTTYGAGVNYKFDTVIDMLDGGNDYYIERWFLEGCWITSATYGDMDYSSSDSHEVDITLRFDNANQTDGLMPQATSESREVLNVSGNRA
jgi:hypothetical protein